MYRCQSCGLLVAACTTADKIVVETRPKQYPVRLAANPGYVTRKRERRARNKKNGRTKKVEFLRVRSGNKGDRVPDSGGQGREIVKELMVCPACVRQCAETNK